MSVASCCLVRRDGVGGLIVTPHRTQDWPADWHPAAFRSPETAYLSGIH